MYPEIPSTPWDIHWPNGIMYTSVPLMQSILGCMRHVGIISRYTM